MFNIHCHNVEIYSFQLKNKIKTLPKEGQHVPMQYGNVFTTYSNDKNDKYTTLLLCVCISPVLGVLLRMSLVVAWVPSAYD